MKSNKLRVIIPLVVLLLVAIGYVTAFGIGTISAFGWMDISLLCPLGSLLTLVASKMAVPRVLISLVVVVVLILLFARAFCGWICPVPVVSKIRGIFGGKASNTDMTGAAALEPEAAMAAMAADKKKAAGDALTEEEKKALKGCSGSCGSCASKFQKLDSRHVILGGSLVSAAIFGFPVFCLICPIGLTLATILLVMRLFAFGDVTWSVIVVPVILILELLVFRKWCSKICPISALMSLIGKGNKTFVPTIDNAKCLESAKGRSCEICSQVCPQGINPRHPEAGMSFSECTKCRACVENCPTSAIKMPFLPQKPSAMPAADDTGAEATA